VAVGVEAGGSSTSSNSRWCIRWINEGAGGGAESCAVSGVSRRCACSSGGMQWGCAEGGGGIMGEMRLETQRTLMRVGPSTAQDTDNAAAREEEGGQVQAAECKRWVGNGWSK
jgi:hypothetical protein